MLQSLRILSPICRRSLQSSRLASTLVVSEPIPPSADSLDATTLSSITAAKKLGEGADGKIDLLLLSESLPAKVADGIDNILQTNCVPLAENVSTAIQKAVEAKEYSHVIASASKFGSNVLPRAAAVLNVSCVTDVIDIISEDTFIRPMYAGNALAKVVSHDSPLKLISVRSTAFDKAEEVESSSSSTTQLDFSPTSLTEFVSANVSKSDRPELTSADVVISGGRGMQSGENFVLLEKLADKLGGAVGASRAAVDAGFVPNDLQVGQTGKVVAPNLYIAVGISGAIQHLSGMKDAKTIVAINKDPDAPIFQVADYGLVADLFKAIPELTEKV